MKHSVQQFETSGGMSVLIIDIPGAPAVDFHLAIRSGFRFAAADGIEIDSPHILEHVIFEGSKKYNSYDSLQEIFTRGGGESNGVTDNYYTNFLFHTRTQYAIDVLAAALDIVFRPKLKEAHFKEEVEVVTNELMDSLDSAAEVDDQTMSQLLPGLDLSISQRLDEIEGISIKTIRNYHKKYYTQRNTTLVVAADLSKLPIKSIKSTLESGLSNIKQGESLPFPKFELAASSELCLPIELDSKYPDVVASFLLAKPGVAPQEEVFILSLFTHIATNMRSYSATHALRKLGYAYALDLQSFQTVEAHGLGLSLVTKEDRLVSTLAYTFAEIRRIVNKGISEAEFTEAKESVADSFIDTEGSQGSIMQWYSEELLINGTVTSPSQAAEYVRGVSQREMLDLVRPLFTMNSVYATVLSSRSWRAATVITRIFQLFVAKKTPVAKDVIDELEKVLLPPRNYQRIVTSIGIGLLCLLAGFAFFNIGTTGDVLFDVIARTLGGWVVVVYALLVLVFFGSFADTYDADRTMLATFSWLLLPGLVTAVYAHNEALTVLTSDSLDVLMYSWLTIIVFVITLIAIIVGYVSWRRRRNTPISQIEVAIENHITSECKNMTTHA